MNIPHTFIPATKAKADEVNENFQACKLAIEAAQNSCGELSSLTTEQKSSLVAAINELVSDLGGLSSTFATKNLDNLSSLGQAILDKKVEVEALLQQNGYAKFSWKENNEISNLIINWGLHSFTGSLDISYPYAYENFSCVVATRQTSATTTTSDFIYIRNPLLNGFNVYSTSPSSLRLCAYIAIGS